MTATFRHSPCCARHAANNHNGAPDDSPRHGRRGERAKVPCPRVLAEGQRHRKRRVILSATHKSGRGNAPEVCLAQPEGLGIRSTNNGKGQRPGHLPGDKLPGRWPSGDSGQPVPARWAGLGKRLALWAEMITRHFTPGCEHRSTGTSPTVTNSQSFLD